MPDKFHTQTPIKQREDKVMQPNNMESTTDELAWRKNCSEGKLLGGKAGEANC